MTTTNDRLSQNLPSTASSSSAIGTIFDLFLSFLKNWTFGIPDFPFMKIKFYYYYTRYLTFLIRTNFFFNINLSIEPYFDEVHLFPRYKTQYPSYFCWRSTFFAARFEVKSICALFLAFSMFNYCFFLVLFFLSAALSKLISAPNFRREHFAKNFGGNFLIFGIEGFLVHLIYGKFLSQT